jgi:hypothetical protein
MFWVLVSGIVLTLPESLFGVIPVSSKTSKSEVEKQEK